MSGFFVSTSFDVEAINCPDLSSEIIQLGIILYPPDAFHEKFLLKIRQCTSALAADHPVKVWFKWVGSPKPISAQEQKTMQFLSEILNSKFNLITDVNVKNKIIDVLTSIPGDSLGEELLRSYLYLMIGNVTRSDNILRTITKRPPYHNWQGYSRQSSVYHQIASSNLEQILKKMSGHPSDRKSFEIFTLYLKNFTNDPVLLGLLDASEANSLEGKWSLKAVSRISPDFHQYLYLSRLEERKRQARIKNSKFTEEFKLYWLWPFFDVNEIVNDSYLPPLATLATVDKLWFYYLLDNERLSDLYIAKKGRTDIQAARTNLRALLKERRLFMLSLYKLIELGDVDHLLVSETLKFLMNE